MRAAAVAIVCILGAAVILVFANSLNSWVLGGLIGGLAALLISIPISVMLFSTLSRRHDLKLQTLHQELGQMGYVDLDDNGYEEVYETDAFVLSDEEYYHQVVNRKMPNAHALPEAGQSQANAQREFNQRTARPTQNLRQASQALQQGRGIGSPTRDLSSDQRKARRSAYEVNALRSRFQTTALRAARREAQEFEEVEVIPTHTPTKRVSPGRTSQPLREQSRSRQARAYPTSPQQQGAPQNGSRRAYASTSGQLNSMRRTVSDVEQYSANKAPQTDSLHMDNLQSGSLPIRSYFPETDALRAHPQSGQLEQSQRNPGMMTGSLKTPLVRRAPYLYEDDPLRHELAQQIDGEPIVRRSSRYLQFENEDE